jgi:hypothetical protein
VHIVVAEVLTTAANAVLVAHHLPEPDANLIIIARPVEELAWRQETRGRKKAGVGAGGGGRGWQYRSR